MDVIYCRSSEWQVGKVSLQTQVAISKREAAKKNIVISDDHILLERGVSGRNLNRPKMIVLLNLIESGKLDHGHVFVSSWDRLTRDLGDLTYLLNLFEEHSIQVHSAKEKIPDDMSPSARTFYIHSLGVISQNYLETCRNHAFVTIERRRKEGKPLGATPYGYAHAGDRLILIPEEAEMIKLIFSLYLSGLGYKKICKELNERGWMIYERPFKDTDIYRILGNQTYAGIFGKGDQSYHGNHQPIVSIVDFENVQQLRKSKRKGKVHDLEYPLRRKLRCSCGWHVSCHTYSPKNGRLRRYYVCANPIHRENGYPDQLPAELVEAQVIQHIRQFLTNQAFIQQLLHHVLQEQDQLKQTEIKHLRKRKKQREQLFSDYESKVITVTDFREQLKQLKEDEMKYRQKHTTVTTEDLSALLLTEEKLEEDFFFNLVKQVALSDSNELISLYLHQLPDYNLVEWGNSDETAITVF